MSWIVTNNKTGAVICEIWNRSTLSQVNTAKYTAIPTMQYLCALNKKIKEENL